MTARDPRPFRPWSPAGCAALLPSALHRQRTCPKRRRVPRSPQGFAAALLSAGAVDPNLLLRALAVQRRRVGRIEDILIARGLVPADALYAAMGRYSGAAVVDPLHDTPDPRLVAGVGAALCLREGLVPWRVVGERRLVVTAHPADSTATCPCCRRGSGAWPWRWPRRAPSRPRCCRRRAPRLHGGPRRGLRRQSCRGWDRGPAAAILVAACWRCCWAAWLAPRATFAVLVGWTVLTMALGAALKLAALVRGWRPGVTPAELAFAPPLPMVSVMVALYREAGIAARLVRRLERLDWPRDRLDVVLVVEERDRLTRDALDRAALPPWMRVAVVPDGPVRTKPRALNFALDLCRGSIIGIYDAEDAPEPDQIRKVAARFAAAGPRVACLQGVLDFYNPRTNWMSRCFALEYAGWFRVILPGLARLGAPVPLGGTTLFLRRDVLEDLGAGMRTM